VQFGQQVSYVISVTNNGPSTATNVIINDPVPNNLSYASAAGANCALALPLGGGNGFVSCDFGSMTVGQTKQVTLTFTTIAPPPNCQAITVTNTATVTSTTPETNSGNNTDSESTQLTCPAPQEADLSVAKTGPNLIQTGNNVEYVVTVTNNGPGTANTVLVRDIVPMGMTFSAFNGNAACQLANNNTEVQCTIATLGAGQSQQIRLIFTTPNPGNNCSAMTATNTAIVSSNTLDPNQGNNIAHAFTTLNCPGNLNFFQTKTGPATIRRGERIT
jgi:uncharacterized repeat protein (TIGR01451 family)